MQDGPEGARVPATSQAKGEAKAVAQETASSAGAVGHTAKAEATQVAHETAYQAKDLIRQSRQELMEQASAQQDRAAQGLRSLHEELGSLASKSEDPGLGTDLVRQAADRAGALADYLGHRDPGSLLEEMKSYARRKPGVFLAVAAGAGLLAGRLTRSLAADATDDGGSQSPATTSGGRASTPGGYPAGQGYQASAYAAGGYPAGSGVPAEPGYEPWPDGYGESVTEGHSHYGPGAVQEGALAGSPEYGAPPVARHAADPGADLAEGDGRYFGREAQPVTDEIPPVPRQGRGAI